MDLGIPSDDPALETLLHALETSPRDTQVVLPGVGWLTVKTYVAYEGRNPRTGEAVSVPDKRLPFFTADPELYRALASLPPSGRSFANERARYLYAIRPDDDEADAEEPATVTLTPGTEIIAHAIRRCLCEGQPAEIPSFGIFDILEKPSRAGANPETGEAISIPARQIVRFLGDAVLKARLNP